MRNPRAMILALGWCFVVCLVTTKYAFSPAHQLPICADELRLRLILFVSGGLIDIAYLV